MSKQRKTAQAVAQDKPKSLNPDLLASLQRELQSHAITKRNDARVLAALWDLDKSFITEFHTQIKHGSTINMAAREQVKQAERLAIG